MKKVTQVLSFLFILFAFNANSQGNFSIHAGPSLPLSDFGSSDFLNPMSAGAQIGLNLGAQYVYPVSDIGIGFFGGIDFMHNSLKSSVKQFIEDNIPGGDIKHYKYINVPITAGINYKAELSNEVSVLLNAGVALNVTKVTTAEVSMFGLTQTTKFSPKANSGLKMGGGFIFNDIVSITADYYYIGTSTIKATTSFMGMSQSQDLKLKVDMLTVTVGVWF